LRNSGTRRAHSESFTLRFSGPNCSRSVEILNRLVKLTKKLWRSSHRPATGAAGDWCCSPMRLFPATWARPPKRSSSRAQKLDGRELQAIAILMGLSGNVDEELKDLDAYRSSRLDVPEGRCGSFVWQLKRCRQSANTMGKRRCQFLKRSASPILPGLNC